MIDAGSTTAACTADALASSAVAEFTVEATAPLDRAGATVTLTAAATSQTDDPLPANNNATASIAVQAIADLSAELSAEPTYPKGTLATHLLVVRNEGPSAATGTVVDVTATTTRARTSIEAPAGWTCVTAATTTFQVSCSPDDGILASTDETAFVVVVDASGRMMPPRHTVRATVSSAVTDPVPGNNASQVERRIGR